MRRRRHLFAFVGFTSSARNGVPHPAARLVSCWGLRRRPGQPHSSVLGSSCCRGILCLDFELPSSSWASLRQRRAGICAGSIAMGSYTSTPCSFPLGWTSPSYRARILGLDYHDLCTGRDCGTKTCRWAHLAVVGFTMAALSFCRH